jgi:hypothetical protein
MLTPGGPQNVLFHRAHGRFHEKGVGAVEEELRGATSRAVEFCVAADAGK